MKNYEMDSVVNGLKEVKLAKLEDKPLSNKLFSIFMLLVGKNRQYKQKQEDMRDFFLSEHKEEQEKVAKLQNDLNLETDNKKRVEIAKEINSHSQYLEDVKQLNEKLDALAKEEVEVELIDADKFQEAYAKQDVDLAVIEKIYPLFK